MSFYLIHSLNLCRGIWWPTKMYTWRCNFWKLFSGDYGWHSCDVHGQGRVIYVCRSLQLWARPTKTRSFHHQILYRKNSSYQCGNFQKICDDKIQVSSIVHQKILMDNWGYLNLVFTKFSDSSHIDDWSSPSKKIGGKKTLFWSDESILGGISVHNNIYIAVNITNVST